MGTGNDSDDKKFQKDVEGEGITFIILDFHAEIAIYLFSTSLLFRIDECYDKPKVY